ncbi:hypothetical protein DF186_23945, partial [Enterococcus hirae]
GGIRLHGALRAGHGYSGGDAGLSGAPPESAVLGTAGLAQGNQRRHCLRQHSGLITAPPGAPESGAGIPAGPCG